MQRVKRRIFSGVVCEQEVYTVSDRANIKKAEPRPRFKDDEERAQHRIGISKRKHQRLVNENFSPLSLYSTLTFDDDSEVHTFSEARRIRDNYFRRLQRACPDAKIIIYMGRGKSTNRIHFHMISDGISYGAMREQRRRLHEQRLCNVKGLVLVASDASFVERQQRPHRQFGRLFDQRRRVRRLHWRSPAL